MTEPCRRHHVVDCDIQRCAEDRRGSQRHAMDDGQLEQAAASVRRLRSARRARLQRRARVDAAYRDIASRQPTPSGHSNRHGRSVSVRDGNGR